MTLSQAREGESQDDRRDRQAKRTKQGTIIARVGSARRSEGLNRC